MDDGLNEHDLVEEYENEDSSGISLVELMSDDDGDIADTKLLDIVTNEGPTEVQTVAYKINKRN